MTSLITSGLRLLWQSLADHALQQSYGVQRGPQRKQYIDGIVLTKFDTVDDKVRSVAAAASPVAATVPLHLPSCALLSSLPTDPDLPLLIAPRCPPKFAGRPDRLLRGRVSSFLHCLSTAFP